MAAEPPVVGKERPDIATLLGVVLAISGIIGGLLLEGGSLKDILQITAAMIVAGGTLGATLVNTPLPVFLGALKSLRKVLLARDVPLQGLIEQLVEYASQARRAGLVSLETEANAQSDPFLRKALGLAVDGCDLSETRKIMEVEIDQYAQHEEQFAKTWEAAGGYSPTIGIIGAVLGLIQVMKKLDNIEEVGHGIAVAFVATVYGVALANIFLIPAGNKIKAAIHREVQRREMVLEGVLAVIEGLNPQIVRSKLNSFLHQEAPVQPDKPIRKARAA